MQHWLKCSLEAGMFPTEYAVAIDTVEAGTVSLFASGDKVDVAQSLVRVDVLQEGEGSVLVRLPSPPFEVSSQNLRVARSLLTTEN